ncbi:TPA: glucan 1,4-alpha-glucosidase [Providencia stuartii]|uniref:glycoside hydrolase family 15 protein n=1 Tax=Providencia stuartii TaxID=588 RepID=UPI0018C6AFAF|nr:glycoside hydrolase family 15 protein [Providencia stuartii]MBG5905922.1 glucan 1,4-alpha-glucosidase [Providencia stuartii]HEM8198886.1 glucan 1,4-alpha-glucosidase [Providencia stuartii]HEM8207636.1 glucan 1,4-alpha-glucosidase [Providencia stuartii]
MIAQQASGAPGSTATWTSSAKDMVGTAIGQGRVWFTVGYGILNEVYWPSCSTPQIRDLGFIIAGDDFWSEVKRVHQYSITTPSSSLPLPKIVHQHERYRLELEIITDPARDVLLIHYHLEGEGLRLYPLLAPHLGGDGDNNYGSVTSQGLAAQKNGQYLILSAENGFARGSVGYVGSSDGWQDFSQNGGMSWEYQQAGPGNIAMIGELNHNSGVLALAFSASAQGAATLANSALAEGYQEARRQYAYLWAAWNETVNFPGLDKLPKTLSDAVRTSVVVLKTHEGRTFPGSLVASLSTPWGDTHKDPGGYHLVWPRDSVEVGFAMLACGLITEVRALLAYLIAIQQPDGHWMQNNFTDGRPYWQGIQLDEVALPVLFAAKLHEQGLLGEMQGAAIRMARKALAFIAQYGPASPQDRWEENSGINPFTLSVSIAALVAGAKAGFLEDGDKQYALDLADDWNERLESWVYVANTELDKELGISGHYIRLNPNCHSARFGEVMLRNRNNETINTRALLGMEYLYLVRLGLRKASDKRIEETTKLVDEQLCVNLPAGPYYYRYNEDGYGEHEDGRAFDGSGVGRLWPLLSGERGHYAAARKEDIKPYLNAILASASTGGMLPEQIWDKESIPERGLLTGRPSGSAMPLIWAHAELIKLIYVQKTGVPIEQLKSVSERYGNKPPAPRARHWRDNLSCGAIPANRQLWIEAQEPFVLHYGYDNWQDIKEQSSQPLGLGLYGVALDVSALAGKTLQFTRRFDAKGWEGRDWQVEIEV